RRSAATRTRRADTSGSWARKALDCCTSVAMRVTPFHRFNGRMRGATVLSRPGVGPLPLVVGLGAAIQRMQDIGMAEVERHGVALRARAYEGLTQIPRLRVIGPPPGPMATAIVACVLPSDIDSMWLRDTLLSKYGIILKMSEKRHFNGFR